MSTLEPADTAAKRTALAERACHCRGALKCLTCTAWRRLFVEVRARRTAWRRRGVA